MSSSPTTPRNGPTTTSTSSAAAFERQLPHSLEAERALLGAMLLDEGAVGEAINQLKGLGSAAFFNERHQKLYEQIVHLYDASQPLDAVVVQEHLRQAGLLEALGGLEYLATLVSAVPSAQRVQFYGRLVRDKCLLRRLIGATNDVLAHAFDDRRPVDEILDDAEQAIFAVTEQRIDEGASDLRDLIQQVFHQIDARDGESFLGEPTGFYELDEMTCGLQPSELIIVAGRPSMGKTAFGLNIAEHLAITERRPVLFFSLEMSKQQLAQRVLCSRARVDAHRLRRGTVQGDDMQRLQQAAHEASDAPLLVDDASNLSVLELRARARLAHRKHKFRAIFVDYLQLMRGPRSESRQVEVAEISRGLKALAKELRVPVVALAQLNRGPEDRGGNRPRMSDLRESGAIEQDADVIMLLHREAYYRAPGENDIDDNTAEVIIAKQRNGPTGDVKLHFNKQWTRFDNLHPGGPAGGGFPA
jgi:replicative DNA helicase